MSNVDLIKELRKDGGAAFPFKSEGLLWTGMTLRDYFAAKAMAAMLVENPDYHQRYEFIDLSDFSYRCADAMLKAREE